MILFQLPFNRSDGHIDCIVKNGSSYWLFTRFYGNPTVAFLNQSWKLLKRLVGIHELKMIPWLVGRDFNEVLHELEKDWRIIKGYASDSGFL